MTIDLGLHQKRALIVSNTPLAIDARVQNCMSAYKARGLEVEFLNARLCSWRFMWWPHRIVLMLLFINIFQWHWYIGAIQHRTKFNHLWRKLDLDRYKLPRWNLPLVFWYETYAHLFRGLAYSFNYHQRLKRVTYIHANDTLALSFVQPILWRHPHIKLIYDAHELSSFRNRKGTSRFSALLIVAFEAASCRKATCLVSVSTPILAWFRCFCRGRNTKFRLVYNDFYERASFKARPQKNITEPDLTRPDIVYVGSLIAGRGLQHLMHNAYANPESRFYIFCPEDNESQRYNWSLFKPAPNIEINFGPYQEKLNDLLRQNTPLIGWIGVEDRCLSYHFAMPNKLFQYLALDLPLICSSQIRLARTLKRHGIGIIFRGFDDLLDLNAALSTQSHSRSSRLLAKLENYNYISLLQFLSIGSGHLEEPANFD